MVKIRKFIRVNDRIRTPQVRLIGSEGEQLGIVSVKKGLELAMQQELDLVEVAPQANPPVCKIMDFKKFKYDQEKKEREAKRHQKQVRLKELRVTSHIEEHDYQVKLRKLKDFLKKHDKVKVSLLFRGREMSHQELGRRVLDKFIKDSQEDGIVEKPPALEGRIMTTVIVSK